MAKVRAGTQSAKNAPVVLRQGAPGGLRKMRCPNCHTLCSSTRTVSGKPIYKCNASMCGAEFSHTRM